MKCDHPSCNHNVVAPGQCGDRLCPRNNPAAGDSSGGAPHPQGSMENLRALADRLAAGDTLPERPGQERLYQFARRTLLDALEALEPYRSALTIVGAQAVYLRSGDADFGVAPSTSDGDVVLDPALLGHGDNPGLGELLKAAGFHSALHDGGATRPGIWAKDYPEISVEPFTVDLIVPDAFAGPGRRAARIGPPHDKHDAGRAKGLEPAIVDRDPMEVSALEPGDQRGVRVDVAGPAALLVAKAYKISDRQTDKGGRLKAKDGSDVYRLMASHPPGQVREMFDRLRADERVGNTTAEGERLLVDLFEAPGSQGVRLAVEAFAGAQLESEVEAFVTEWVRQFCSARPV